MNVIENDRLRVAVTPAYGARVVSLLDKLSGREWMTTGPESPNTGEEVRYWGDEAVAWDECFGPGERRTWRVRMTAGA